MGLAVELNRPDVVTPAIPSDESGGQRNPPIRTSIQRASSSSSNRIAAIDGLRGLAALMVIWVHYSDVEQPGTVTKHILNIGNFAFNGLDLFFVISGFLLAGILFDNKEAKNYYSTFYIRRICRLFPLYYLMIGLYLLARTIHPTGEAGFLWGVPLWTFLVFVQNIPMAMQGALYPWFLGPTWSLAIEEQFYAVLPFTIRNLKKWQIATIVAFLVIVGLVTRVFIVESKSLSYFAAYWLTICRLDTLGIGVLTAMVVRWRKIPERLLVITAAILFPVNFYLTMEHFTPLVNAWSRPLVGVFIATVVIILYQYPENRLSRIFRLKPLLFMGTISYGVYMFHIPTQYLVFWIGGEYTRHIIDSYTFMLSIAAATCTIGLAHLSWMLFEKPLLRIGHKRMYKAADKNAEPASPKDSSVEIEQNSLVGLAPSANVHNY